MTTKTSVEPIGPEAIDLPGIEAFARKQACMEAILGIIPIGDVYECIQRIIAEEIQKQLDPDCVTSDPRGAESATW